MNFTVPVSEVPKKWKQKLPPKVSDDMRIEVTLKVVAPTPDPEVEREKREGKIKSFEVNSETDLKKIDQWLKE